LVNPATKTADKKDDLCDRWVMHRILLLEDNEGYASFLGTMLSDEGFEVSAFNCSLAALAVLDQRIFSAIITDLSLPQLGGTNLVERIREAAPQTPIIVISGFYFPTMLQELRVAGATDAVAKPFRFDMFVQKLKTVIKAHEESKGRPIAPC
jgi:DNA-binding NtrC family response regulator